MLSNIRLTMPKSIQLWQKLTAAIIRKASYKVNLRFINKVRETQIQNCFSEINKNQEKTFGSK